MRLKRRQQNVTFDLQFDRDWIIKSSKIEDEHLIIDYETADGIAGQIILNLTNLTDTNEQDYIN